MKKIIDKILYCITVCVLLVACSDELAHDEMDSMKGRIVIDFSSGMDFDSRTVDDTDVERYLSHLDIMVFKADDGILDFHQRVENPLQEGENSQGTVTLTKGRDQFERNAEYNIYVVANSNLNVTEFNGIGTLTLDNLKIKIQTDNNLHLTGINHISNVSGQAAATDIPAYFLMDGSITNQILYTGDEHDLTTSLTVKLTRAASKIVVKCKPKGNNVKFLHDLPNEYDDILVKEPMYRVRNLPINTKILAGVPLGNNVELKNTASTFGSYYHWKDDGSVEVTLYVYEHSWNTNDNFTRGTNLVLNIPLIINSNDKYPANYYQIPLAKPIENNSNDFVCSIGRNKYYEIVAEIGSPGSINMEDPVTLESLKFSTLPWTPENIDVSGSDASYLEVTPSLVEMHNVDVDASTLKFTSSSPISVEVVNTQNDYPYYFDKYSRKQKVTFQAVKEEGKISINPVPDAGTSGNITINSSKPGNLTERYFKLRVTNDDGNEAYVNVIQYPVICVSNQLGWYSYRSDFVNSNGQLMTWQSRYNGGYVSVRATNKNGVYDKDQYGTSASNSSYGTTYFFNSKVIDEDAVKQNKTAASYDDFYYDNRGKSDRRIEGANMRMYQIQVMSTSEDYVVGIPRIDANGVTDQHADNQKLVSPAFMIASRLGAVFPNLGGVPNLKSGGDGGWVYNNETKTFSIGKLTRIYNDRDYRYDNDNYEQWQIVTSNNANAYDIADDEVLKFYANHCKNYVEVVGSGTDTIRYENWRLPTASEIVFIINNQGKSKVDNAEAIDYLLNGAYYYSAAGPVYNPNREQSDKDKAIRCVHDLFDSKKMIVKKEE